ncbi:unnamed protein product [Blepharisma stoltei]|uniref:Uncharacterized protein n=1 Tax=Blepharisma stoltei TaxID=1481888 RepID=A0AAU9J1H2_9CILI|nr:unnamed protein product [Blepharisma stoltei]
MEDEFDNDKHNESFGDSRINQTRTSIITFNRRTVTIEEDISKNPELADSEDLNELKKVISQPDSIVNMPLRLLLKITGTLFQIALTVFSCIIYVTGTYYSDSSGVFSTLEIVIALLFTVDYLWGFVNAKDKKKFMLKPLNLIDLAVVLPIFISLVGNSNNADTVSVTKLFRVIRVVRVLRLYRIFTTTVDPKTLIERPLFVASDVTRQILIAIISVFSLIFISAGIVFTLQQTSSFNISLPVVGETMTFDKAFYYIIITTGTVGYGDMAPTTNLARAFIGIFIIVAVIIMTQQTSRLGELIKRSSPYKTPYKTDPGKHVVVSGTFNGITLYRFLREFYHPDHDMPMKKCKILIVRNEQPSKEILSILNHPLYEEAVSYLEADFMNEQTLIDAAVSISKGVFILTNQYQDDIGASDTYAILASSAVKEHSNEIPVFLQLIRPDLLIHHYWAGWETGFSSWKLKLCMLAANVFIPGFSTLMSNLVTSSTNTMKKEAENNHWLYEYMMGLSNEVYLTPFPKHIYGEKFSEIAKNLYLKHNSLLIGVQTKMADPETLEIHYEILLNPTEYQIQEDDNAFIIAADIEDARGIEDSTITEVHVPVFSDEIYAEFSQFKTPITKKSVCRDLEEKHLIMWEHDLRGSLWDHILIFGRIEHLEIFLDIFTKITEQTICYVSDQPPDERWERINQSYKEAFYLECSLIDVEELSHTAINFAYHVILLSTRISGSAMDDSGILPIVNIIEGNFSCKFTVELVDEINMKYLEKKPSIELESMPFITWPRYAASHVFLSSTLDYIIAQGFHNNYIIDLIQRLIIYEDIYAETGIDENYQINSIDLPISLSGRITFGEIFIYFINLPRPVIALGIYRGVGYLNNEVPYVYTKPDPNTPLFENDKIFVMGELNNRENSPFLQDVRRKKRKDTIIDLGRKKSLTKAAQSLLVRKETAAENAIKLIEEEDKDPNQMLEDEVIMEMVRNFLCKTRNERDIIRKQNETLLNLANEYSSVQKLLLGFNSAELDSSSKSLESP